MTPSLIIGSSTLGWHDLGTVAQLGTMTRAMPGGDGSLDFVVPAVEAGRHRNVLRHGAEVHLVDGPVRWDGRIVGDPLGDRFSTSDPVEVAAAGLWAHAANRRDVAAVWVDSDPTQWLRLRQRWDASTTSWVTLPDQGKFASDTEGRLYLRADSDRTYAAYARASLFYWLSGGLVDIGWRIYGVDITYMCNVPSPWRVALRSANASPWACASTGTLELAETTSRSSWYTQQVNMSQESTSVVLSLHHNTSSSGSPASDPYVHVSSVTVYCGRTGRAVDRSVTLDEAMRDLATLDGLATVTRIPAAIGSAQPQLALRPDAERSVADGLRELAAIHSQVIEQYFDWDGAAWRYTANVVPAAVDPARNNHWVLDEARAGEDSSGVVRDYEVAPEYLRVHYLSSGVDAVPDGTPRTYCYPSTPSSATAHVAVYTGLAEAKLTDSQAASMAARVWAQMQSGGFAGEATFGRLALTRYGRELPSALMRPGDRVDILGRANAADLYVAETSYDFAREMLTARLGWPYELTAPPLLRGGVSGAHPGVTGPTVGRVVRGPLWVR